MYKHHQEVSHESTPLVDGNGKQVIKHRPDGKDYIEDSWMNDRLNRHFPGWSWERAGGIQFLGSEWVCADGELSIIDLSLIPLGVNPIRKYWSGDAVRIQFKKDMPHTIENVIDIGDNVQSAITGAKKRAINRLCGIGDDIYGKRVESEGAGTFDSMIEANANAKTFAVWIESKKLAWSEVLKILKISDLSEVSDWDSATKKIKEAKKW